MARNMNQAEKDIITVFEAAKKELKANDNEIWLKKEAKFAENSRIVSNLRIRVNQIMDDFAGTFGAR